MTAPYILGIDLSSRRVDCAAIPLYEPPVLGKTIHLTYADIEQPKKGEHVDPAERAIRAGQAARTCLQTLHARGIEPHSAAVEHPGGRHVHPVLYAAFGAICGALDEYPVASFKAAEWRKAIGCVGAMVNSKQGGAARVADLIWAGPPKASLIWSSTFTDLEPDALDAIGVALAHRNRTLQHEAAA